MHAAAFGDAACALIAPAQCKASRRTSPPGMIVSDAAGPPQGGLPGLVMRLRQDGHGTLHIAGPVGVAAALESVESFISWIHPAVHVLECSRWDMPVIYKVSACRKRFSPAVCCC